MRVKVYRPELDRFRGEIVGDLADYLLGEVVGVVVGAPSIGDLRRFPGVVDTSAQLGIPWEQTSGITVQQHDRLVGEDNHLYVVTSDRLWTQENTLTGERPSHYWVEIRASS